MSGAGAWLGTGSRDFADVPTDQYLRARGAADANLYEGFARRRAGVLAPRDWAVENLPLDTGVAGTVESWFARTEVVAECPPETALTVRLRFLQSQRRSVDRYLPDTGFVPAARLDVDGWSVANAEETVAHERDVTVDLDALRAEPVEVVLEAIGTTEHELVRAANGEVRGRVRRVTRPLQVRMHIAAAPAGLVVPMMRLRVLVENVTPGVAVDASPAAATAHSLIATHCFLGLSDGGFVSLLDPPPWAADATAECTNIHAFPVLAGDGGREDLMLSAPVVLPDYPHGQPLTFGDELDAVGTDPTVALPLPTPVTPATYPVGPVAEGGPSTVDPHWIVLRPA